jgi:hypothetical protein
MLRGKVFYNCAFDDYTVIEVSSGEAKWLNDTNQGCPWESNGGTNQWIKITFKDKNGNPISKQIAGIQLLGHNLVTGDTCYLDAANNSNFTNPITNQIDVNKRYLEVTLNYPYLKLRMNKVSGNIEISELFLFQGNYTFEKNPEWGEDNTPIIEETSVTVDGGQAYRETKYEIQTRGLTFTWIKDSQRNKLKEIAKSNYAIYFPKGIGEWLYGIFRINKSSQEYGDETPYYNMDLTFMENPA